MKFCQMSLLILSAGLFDTMLGSGSNAIPTKEEQVNLLTNVQEIFEQVKLLVSIEANSTDEFIISDANKILQRAKDKLELVKEISLTKLSCTSNKVCMLGFRQTIEQLTMEGVEALKVCVTQTSKDVTENSFNLKNTTIFATECGQNLLDTLYNCSRKPGLQVISCYKDVFVKEVPPAKKTLLEAIEAHKEGHFKTIEIQHNANNCFDHLLKKYQDQIAGILHEALHCS